MWEGGDVTPEQLTGYFAPFIRGESRSRTGREPHSFKSYTKWEMPPDDSDDESSEGRFVVTVEKATNQRMPDFPQDTYRDILEWMRGL